MSVENPLWGAPRIHGELLKLGFEIAQSSVARYMIKRRGPPSQGWRTFLRNRTSDIAAMDLFVVPTIGFDLLLRRILRSHASDHNDIRTHRSMDKAIWNRPGRCGAVHGLRVVFDRGLRQKSQAMTEQLDLATPFRN